MYNFLLGLYLLVAVGMIGMILFQKSPGLSLQAKNSFAGPRARGNALTKLTGFLAFLFMLLCLILTRMNIAKKNNIAIQRDKLSKVALVETVDKDSSIKTTETVIEKVSKPGETKTVQATTITTEQLSQKSAQSGSMQGK